MKTLEDLGLDVIDDSYNNDRVIVIAKPNQGVVHLVDMMVGGTWDGFTVEIRGRAYDLSTIEISTTMVCLEFVGGREL